MIKENRLAGFIFNIVSALIIIGISILSIYLSYNSTNVEALKKKNLVLNSKTTNATNSDSVVLTVYKVITEPIGELDDGTLLYAIQYNQEGDLIGVQANSGDNTIKTLIENNDTLTSKPKEIAVEYHNTLVEKQSNASIKDYDSVLETMQKDNKELYNISHYSYLSISNQKKQGDIYIGASIITILIGLLTASKGFRTRRVINETYDNLYNKFPELENNLDLIITNSSYRDDEFKLAIYKNHLVTYHKALYYIDLNTVTSLQADYSIISLTDGLFNNRTDIFLKATSTDYPSGYRLLVKKVRKGHVGHLRNLYIYIEDNFPNINTKI